MFDLHVANIACFCFHQGRLRNDGKPDTIQSVDAASLVEGRLQPLSTEVAVRRDITWGAVVLRLRRIE